MTWQGAPFPFLETHRIDAGLSVSNLPEILVNTAFSWDTVAGAVLAAFIGGMIPALIAWYTIRKNDRASEQERGYQVHDMESTREMQLQIARLSFNAQVLSNNRQQWINTLRRNVSESISLVEHRMSLHRHFDIETGSIASVKDPKKIEELVRQIWEAKRKIAELSIEINLMLNPDESLSKRIIQDLDHLNTLASDEHVEMLFIEGSELRKEFLVTKYRLMDDCKKCLKKEWDRVKCGE